MNPFDFIKDINYDKKYLLNGEFVEKEYNQFLTNRAFCLYSDTIFFAQEMNKAAHIDNKMHHDYMFYSIRRKRRFEKWPWKKKSEENLELIMRVYKYSRNKARQVLPLFSQEQLDTLLKEQEEKGGLINDRNIGGGEAPF